ncbi:hypothetical protein DPMN_103901 [Dreissena polymorpha]|uniref:Uncharacterized protein n=1 Tax=Dreissena polymorpha TaxID=45954 RepID=A0A9D4HAL4_DREPO|nr:hypothetical protein DPMN_103901 [Dreissena polymorpha]
MLSRSLWHAKRAFPLSHRRWKTGTDCRGETSKIPFQKTGTNLWPLIRLHIRSRCVVVIPLKLWKFNFASHSSKCICLMLESVLEKAQPHCNIAGRLSQKKAAFFPEAQDGKNVFISVNYQTSTHFAKLSGNQLGEVVRDFLR